MSVFNVSVVIPVFRGRATIARAVNSVERQSVQPQEILVIDNEPDADLELSIPLTRRPLRVVREPRRGAARARNAGLLEARGFWVAFLDCDDAWSTDFLRAMRDATDRHDAALFAGGAVVQTQSGVRRVHSPRFGRDPFRHVLLQNDINTSATMVRRDATLRCGGFMEGLIQPAGCEDWALWLTITRHFVVASVPSAIAMRYEDELSARRLDVESSEADMRTVLHRVFNSNSDERLRAAGGAGLLLRRGTLLLAANRRRDARRALRSAIRLYPASMRAWSWAGLAHLPPATEAVIRRLFGALRRPRRAPDGLAMSPPDDGMKGGRPS